MKNKRGMTVVELITSFALVISIATLLLGIIINLRDIYESSGIKTQLLNKQAQISQTINNKLLEQEIETVANCGNGCLNFKYKDGTSDLLILDNVNKTIEFGSYKTQILNDSYFKDPKAEVVYANTFGPDSNDAILNINIPIYNDYLEGQNFGINIIYPFNTSKVNINSVSLDFDGTDGLLLHYSGITQPVNGIWPDLSGNGNDGTLTGFDSNSGWDTNHIRFDGVNDYVISKNNLGISGDSSLTLCTVASWQGSSWSTGWPSYMGINVTSGNAGLSMTMNSGKPAIDFWNNRYLSNTALSVGQIYHICVTKSPGNISTTSVIYVNGVSYAGTGNTTVSPDIIDAKAVVGRLDSTRWANANIYDAKFYNRTLTQAEVQELYQMEKRRYGF